jgi:hypothetical protein
VSRLDKVTVAYSRGRVVLPWASRDAILNEIRHLDGARGTVTAFEAVGASAPVKLAGDDVAFLVEQLNRWSERVNVANLPEGVWELRCALHDDLYDTA